jgi:hypothetical protein
VFAFSSNQSHKLVWLDISSAPCGLISRIQSLAHADLATNTYICSETSTFPPTTTPREKIRKKKEKKNTKISNSVIRNERKQTKNQ